MPLLEYTAYRPGEGGFFADALQLAEDLRGVNMGEVLGEFPLIKATRTILIRANSWMAPHGTRSSHAVADMHSRQAHPRRQSRTRMEQMASV